MLLKNKLLFVSHGLYKLDANKRLLRRNPPHSDSELPPSELLVGSTEPTMSRSPPTHTGMYRAHGYKASTERMTSHMLTTDRAQITGAGPTNAASTTGKAPSLSDQIESFYVAIVEKLHAVDSTLEFESLFEAGLVAPSHIPTSSQQVLAFESGGDDRTTTEGSVALDITGGAGAESGGGSGSGSGSAQVATSVSDAELRSDSNESSGIDGSLEVLVHILASMLGHEEVESEDKYKIVDFFSALQQILRKSDNEALSKDFQTLLEEALTAIESTNIEPNLMAEIEELLVS